VNDLGVLNQPDVPSLALGSGLVTPLELTSAYAVFPTAVSRPPARPRLVVDAQRRNRPRRAHRARPVLPPECAFQMVTMLEDVVERGTGASARTLGVRASSAARPARPTIITTPGSSGSIVGGRRRLGRIRSAAEDPRRRLRRAVALPIWADFMRRTARRLRRRVRSAGQSASHELCLLSYQRPLDGCPTYIEYFKEGDSVPTQLCPIHSGSFKQETERVVRGIFGSDRKGIRGIFR
jgi:penicillin-binding protein 1A